MGSCVWRARILNCGKRYADGGWTPLAYALISSCAALPGIDHRGCCRAASTPRAPAGPATHASSPRRRSEGDPEHLGPSTTGPPIAPARIASSREDAPWQDDVPALQKTLR